MKKTISFLFVLLMFSNIVFAVSKELENAVQTISEQIIRDLKTENESIAIPPFLTFDNKTTALGKMLSEKLIGKFAESKTPSDPPLLLRGNEKWLRKGTLIPVERDFIFKLIDEMKLGMTGLVEPKTVQQVGKFSGASYVLVGSIQKVGKDIQINARLVRTETSKVEKSFEATLKGTPEILELLSQEITSPLIPSSIETEQQKLLKIDFEKLKNDYSKLQGELEELKKQIAQVKDDKAKLKIQEKQKQTQKQLSANSYFAKGSIDYDLGNYNSAIENWNKAIEMNPNEAAYYNDRGVAYWKLGGSYSRAL